LRSVRRLRRGSHREAEGLLLAEGPQAIREALACGVVESLVATAQGAARQPELVAPGWWEVDEATMGGLADTVTPSGLLAVCRWEPRDASWWDLAGVAAQGRDEDEPLASPAVERPAFVLVCDQIRDPGNLGTVLRCADAFGADAVVLSHGSVDVTNMKAVRASAGSLFHLPVVADADLAESVTGLKRAGLTVLASDGQGDVDLADFVADGTLSGPVAWLMGNEAWGLPDQDRALADHVVRIPMPGRAESLNLAAAAAICLYATASARA